MKKSLLIAGCLINLLALNPASAKDSIVPEEPDVRKGVELAGSTMAFTVQRGSGELTRSGNYTIYWNPSANELQPVSGNMQLIRALNQPDACFFSYVNVANAHCGHVIFTNLAPLAGTFTNILFDSTNVPAVVVGRQKGRFFRSDNRIDLNLDGDSEFLYQNTDGRLGVWFMTNSIKGLIQLSNLVSGIYLDSLYVATGHTTEDNTPDIDPNWRIVTQRDSNGDGILDWYWQNTQNGNLRLWQFTTNSILDLDLADPSTVTEADITDAQPGPEDGSKLVGVSDFNNDRQQDFLYSAPDGHLFIVYSGESFNTDHVVRTNQNGTIYYPPVTGFAPWTVGSIADINHDGWPDIIWQHTNGTIRVWLMKENGTYRTSVSIANATPYSYLRLVGNNDFNHDGYMDLMFRNTKSGNIVAWYLKGPNRIKTVNILGPNLGWNIVGPK